MPLHRDAERAALAATCAARVGRFAPMRDLLFKNADSLSDMAMGRLAREAGVADSVAFRRCMLSRETIDAVIADGDAAAKLELTGTPAFLVNDQLVLGYHPGILDSLVRAQRSGKRSAP